MKILLLYIFLSVCSAHIIQHLFKKGERYFYFPGDDGKTHLIDVLRPLDENFLARYMEDPNKNTYLLYTRKHPTTPEVLINGNEKQLSKSDIDLSKITVFLVHGWLGDGHDAMNVDLTAAFLYKNDVNVIVVDWSNLSHKYYTTAKAGVPEAGRSLGKFISWLGTQGLLLDLTHLVGFSLGGQLVGNAGRELHGGVRRITALDPAQPLWIYDVNRITSKDGRYVEAIHTNTRSFGYITPCGHVDHYPNGGSTMPGCSQLDFPCSHFKAWQYMAATVKYNNLYGFKCDDYEDVTKNKCHGVRLPMGNDHINKTGSGMYRGVTTAYWPYSFLNENKK